MQSKHSTWLLALVLYKPRLRVCQLLGSVLAWSANFHDARPKNPAPFFFFLFSFFLWPEFLISPFHPNCFSLFGTWVKETAVPVPKNPFIFVKILLLFHNLITHFQFRMGWILNTSLMPGTYWHKIKKMTTVCNLLTSFRTKTPYSTSWIS